LGKTNVHPEIKPIQSVKLLTSWGLAWKPNYLQVVTKPMDIGQCDLHAKSHQPGHRGIGPALLSLCLFNII